MSCHVLRCLLCRCRVSQWLTDVNVDAILTKGLPAAAANRIPWIPELEATSLSAVSQETLLSPVVCVKKVGRLRIHRRMTHGSRSVH